MPNGTVSASIVEDIFAGATSSVPASLTAVGSSLYFTADDGSHGDELWKSDGTTLGTDIVLDIDPGGNSYPTSLTRVGTTLFFAADQAGSGRELWKSDAGGTSIVKDIVPSVTGSTPENFVDVNGTLFFTASNSAEGRELWKSNGTDVGTVPVKDVWPGFAPSNPFAMTNVRGTLFFVADHPDYGRELWSCDGTAAGTDLVLDIYPGSVKSIPNDSAPDFLGGCDTLYFSAFRPADGRELWRVVPLPNATFTADLVADINPGTANSDPQLPTWANGTLYFPARSAATGRELYKIAVSQPAMGTNFAGITRPESAANNPDGFGTIPPDPYVAVGPSHVVSIVNRSIIWQNKDGTQVSPQGLHEFFQAASPAPGTTHLMFDPKVLYDTYSCTFIVVALWKDDPGHQSRIYVAQSDNHDPNGSWTFKVINSMVVIGVDRWADYPGVGVSRDALYITANMFAFGVNGAFGGCRLWIVDKRTPITNASAHSLPALDPQVGAAANAFTFQPAHMYGLSKNGLGTFLLSFIADVGGANDHLYVVRYDDPLAAAPTVTASDINLGDITTSILAAPRMTSPQAGGAPLIDAAGDDRLYNAVWRNNSLWTTNTTNPNAGDDAAQATVRWYRIDTTDLANVAVSDQGIVGGEDLGVGTHTYYPQVMVDSANNMAVGFAASNMT
ncbi:MAG: ELWxxDGT repeat protein, partial [Tepidisphaeraceae bacterium]